MYHSVPMHTYVLALYTLNMRAVSAEYEWGILEI